MLIAVLFIVTNGLQRRFGQSPTPLATVSPVANNYAWLVGAVRTYGGLTSQLGLWDTLEGPMRAEVARSCTALAEQYNRAAQQSKAALFLDKKLPYELDIENCQ
mgnify:FL=1